MGPKEELNRKRGKDQGKGWVTWCIKGSGMWGVKTRGKGSETNGVQTDRQKDRQTDSLVEELRSWKIFSPSLAT